MSSQHSDDQTARSRPLQARQSRCLSPFTRAGSRLPLHCTPVPIGHHCTTNGTLSIPHGLQEGRGCPAAADDSRGHAENRRRKMRPGAGITNPHRSPIHRVKITRRLSPTTSDIRSNRAHDRRCHQPTSQQISPSGEDCSPPPAARSAAPPVPAPAPGLPPSPAPRTGASAGPCVLFNGWTTRPPPFHPSTGSRLSPAAASEKPAGKRLLHPPPHRNRPARPSPAQQSRTRLPLLARIVASRLCRAADVRASGKTAPFRRHQYSSLAACRT